MVLLLLLLPVVVTLEVVEAWDNGETAALVFRPVLGVVASGDTAVETEVALVDELMLPVLS